MSVHLTNAIVRPPGDLYASGFTTAGLGTPDLALAKKQHRAYVAALEECGLEVLSLPAEDTMPDATFVEDTAVLTRNGAIMTLPGEPERQLELKSIRQALGKFFKRIRTINEPGTVDAGDVLHIESRFFIGLSKRTNPEGAQQLSRLLERLGHSSSFIPVQHGLHLKSSISSLDAGRIVLAPWLDTRTEFMDYERLVVPELEEYAANSLWINGKVLVPAGFDETRDLLVNAGYSVIELDVSEFEKQDGGLSCLSLRW